MAPRADHLVLHETDEADNHTAVFIYSEPSDSSKPSSARVDISPTFKPPSSWSKDGLIALLCDVFLPSGFPDSVTTDYLPYQIYDSLQAFCSSIAGLLSSRAVLQGIGVGNVDASPTNALLLHILQDISGRIATILFAHRVGTALEPECKTYRLAADVFNDIAMIMDCLSPMVPAGTMRVSVLSTAGVLRALCGVAAGSSKASLSAHFAKWGNLAELNAKDSSQETIISLVGMLVGSVIISHITGFMMTWAALLFLLASHLSLNYAAVRSVEMTSLNRQRASMVFSSIIESDNYSTKKKVTNLPIPTPAQIALDERILAKWSPFFWSSQQHRERQSLGTAEMGVSLAEFFARSHEVVISNAGSDKDKANAITATTTNNNPSRAFHTSLPLKSLKTLFEKEEYLLYLTPQSQSKSQPSKWHASILLTPSATTKTQLKAWCHALIVARALIEPEPTPTRTRTQSPDPTTEIKESTNHENATNLNPNTNPDTVFEYISETLMKLNEDGRFEGYLSALQGRGWDVDVSALEVRAGRRVLIEVS